MNTAIAKERAIENLRRLRENGGLRFDLARAFEKDLCNLEEFSNNYIQSFSKEFFLNQLEIYACNKPDLKSVLRSKVNSIWH